VVFFRGCEAGSFDGKAFDDEGVEVDHFFVVAECVHDYLCSLLVMRSRMKRECGPLVTPEGMGVIVVNTVRFDIAVITVKRKASVRSRKAAIFKQLY
jgi:hypothetical protein